MQKQAAAPRAGFVYSGLWHSARAGHGPMMPATMSAPLPFLLSLRSQLPSSRSTCPRACISHTPRCRLRPSRNVLDLEEGREKGARRRRGPGPALACVVSQARSSGPMRCLLDAGCGLTTSMAAAAVTCMLVQTVPPSRVLGRDSEGQKIQRAQPREASDLEP